MNSVRCGWWDINSGRLTCRRVGRFEYQGSQNERVWLCKEHAHRIEKRAGWAPFRGAEFRWVVIYRVGTLDEFAWLIYGDVRSVSQGEQIADDLTNRYGAAFMLDRERLATEGLPTTFERQTPHASRREPGVIA